MFLINSKIKLLLTFSFSQPAQKEIEIVADEDQIFLMKLKGQLAQNEPSNTNTVSGKHFLYLTLRASKI